HDFDLKKKNSSQSYLGNPFEETLIDAEELDEPIAKTKPNAKPRGSAIKYDFYSEFKNIEYIQKQIVKNETHGGPFIFKFQNLDTEEFVEVDNLNCKEFYSAPIITY
ncbi:hypothetical protein BpHYR1_048630, partial [Brachionus plicatilis]